MLTPEELKFVNAQYAKRTGDFPFHSAIKFYKDGKLEAADDNDWGIVCNTTVGIGREFINQRVFGAVADFNGFVNGDFSNHKVTHFGIGSGGSTIDGNNIVTLEGPAVCDLDLYTPEAINNVALTSPSGIANVCKSITSSTGGAAGSITSQISTHNEFNLCPNIYHTITRCVCVVEDVTEPTALANNVDSLKFDEMALYATEVNLGVFSNPVTFAHLCFPPKFIQLPGQNAFEWYIIF